MLRAPPQICPEAGVAVGVGRGREPVGVGVGAPPARLDATGARVYNAATLCTGRCG